LQAVCALLVARYRLSRRGLVEWVADVGGEAVSLGCLTALEQKTSAALAGAYDEAKAAVASAPVVNADETRWRHQNQKGWLWLARTALVSCFRIDPSRSRAAMEQLLPPTAPGQVRTVICDRYSAYQHLTGDERQVCFAHLLREFGGLAQMPQPAKKLGEEAVQLVGELFGEWHAYRAGEISWERFQERMRPVMAGMGRVLRRGRDSRHWRAEVLGRELLRQWACLWTFVRVMGVEPTNNLAEQAVRPGVLWRKNCFGNQSEEGRAFVERMLTVVGTLRLQGRSVLEYLEAAIRAAQVGGRPPSLLPEASV
jgi:transposase